MFNEKPKKTEGIMKERYRGLLKIIKRINLPFVSTIIGHLLLATILLLMAIGFSEYGIYTAVRVIIVLLNIILQVILIVSSVSGNYDIEEDSYILVWINGIYYVFISVIFTLVKISRSGWILLDYIFLLVYLTLMVLWIIFKPIRKKKDKKTKD